MALLHDAVEFKKLDVRMVERNLDRGMLAREDFEKSLLVLPDDEQNADWVNIDNLTDEAIEKESNGRT